ncbi:MAG: EAL domain-containing protein [Ruminococcaceae bacterium]|nr:EAL domain-containing protein [Oscillospiraceae bacterium]
MLSTLLFSMYLKNWKMGLASRLFAALLWVSYAAACAEVAQMMVAGSPPLTDAAITAGSLLFYVFITLHASMNVLYLLFLFTLTRTTFQIKNKRAKFVLSAPYYVMLALLAQNLFTHNVFRITAESGYVRGPLMIWSYAISYLYFFAGFVYLFFSRRYLDFWKWFSLMGFYVLILIALHVRLLVPDLRLEMFAAAIILMLIQLFVLCPEEITDQETGLLSFRAYQQEVRKVLLSRHTEQIIVIRFINANEVRSYFGENDFNAYIRQAARDIGALFDRQHIDHEMYFERPGTLYVVSDAEKYEGQYELIELFAQRRKVMDDFTKTGVRLLPRVCHINCPTDMSQFDDVLYMGHEFFGMVPYEQVYTEASELLGSKSYPLERNIDSILKRAIVERRFEMYYQPIYSVKEKRFCAAEALIRLRDNANGFISPGYFVPVAESRGLILPIGDFVLEEVFRFISEHDLEAMGLSYVEINLSVTQCMQRDLVDKVQKLEEKFGVSPKNVNFEITETTYDSIGGIMDENIRRLSERGYSFSLDDYGTGYSNIQRISKLPLKIIKIDKSLVDGMAETHGMSILRNTVSMMQDIGMELVVEGVETAESQKTVSDMSCDYIQGFYYSKPLSEEDFVSFIDEHR